MARRQRYGVPDEENPEWTTEEIRTAKTFAQAFPDLAVKERKRRARHHPTKRTGAKKRISFAEFDACHLYLYLTWFQRIHPDLADCALCKQIEARLHRFIGEPEARRLTRETKRELATKGYKR